MRQRIRDKRVECRLTQEELGTQLGVKRQSVHKWEKGEVENISRSKIAQMAGIFRCSPEWLMGFDGAKVKVTYHAHKREPVTLLVDKQPIIGKSSLQAKLYDAALKVKPENYDVAIRVLESLAK